MAKQNGSSGAHDGLRNRKMEAGSPATSSTSSTSGCTSGSAGLKWTLKLFQDYLRHLGMVTVVVVVALLACSLKGNDRYLAG